MEQITLKNPNIQNMKDSLLIDSYIKFIISDKFLLILKYHIQRENEAKKTRFHFPTKRTSNLNNSENTQPFQKWKRTFSLCFSC